MIQLGGRYNILIEFGILGKLVRLLKMCLNATYSRLQVGKHLSDMFPTKKGLKQSALLLSLFNFTLEYAIRGIKVNQDDLKVHGIHQLLVCADVNILGGSICAVQKNTDALVVDSKEVGLEVNAVGSKYMVMS